MKALLFILMLCSPVIGLSQQKQQKPSISQTAIAAELAPAWNDYVKACANDSTLQIYWVYTGKEKPEMKLDSTIVKGTKTKVVTILPTQQMNWIKQPPTWAGFEKYLENKK